MIYAAMNNYLDIVNYLTVRAKDINVEDDNGNTLLSIFLEKNLMSCLRKVLGRGADINYCNKDGKTVLHEAVEKGYSTKVIRFLLRKGANPHIMDKNR
ncbi:MAG: ankyrin repeat domain-containing protein [Candidatus Roizmanbacteria bacterium]